MAGNKNSGRKCDWFIERCAEIINEEKLLDFVGRVASGAEIEQRVVVVRDGNSAHTEVVDVKCAIQDRLSAFKMLAEWGIGKPTSIETNQLIPVMQNIVNEQAVMKIIYALTYPERTGASQSGSDTAAMDRGTSPIQAGTRPA